MSPVSGKLGLRGLGLSQEQMSRRQVSVSGGNTGDIDIDTLESLKVMTEERLSKGTANDTGNKGIISKLHNELI